jgi:uncharacterized membrane protein (DUF106 family)
MYSWQSFGNLIRQVKAIWMYMRCVLSDRSKTRYDAQFAEIRGHWIGLVMNFVQWTAVNESSKINVRYIIASFVNRFIICSVSINSLTNSKNCHSRFFLQTKRGGKTYRETKLYWYFNCSLIYRNSIRMSLNIRYCLKSYIKYILR